MEYAIKQDQNYESIEFSGKDSIQTKSKSSMINLQARIGDNDFVDYQKIQQKDTVTLLSFPDEVKLRLSSKSPFNYTIPGVEPRYYNKTKITDYLYEIDYGNIDYDYAKEYFDGNLIGGCSAVRNGNFFGRNFDWYYNQDVTFVVHTPSSIDRFGVLGVSGIVPGVDKDNADDEDITVEGVDMHKLIPFYLLDGVNEHGLFCTHNVVPLDDETSPTTKVTAKKEEIDNIYIPMVVRFVLDKFRSANEAINYLRDYTTLNFSEEMIDKGFQSHIMIGDNSNTFIIEFEDGEMIVTKKNYITNFNINGVEFGEDGKVIYPMPTVSGINKYGMGLERWDIITEGYKDSNTLTGMMELMDKVKYSNCYGDDFWYSEIVKMTDDNGGKITVDTDSNDCDNAKQNVKYLWSTKDRDNPKVWWTQHSSVYDIRKKELYIKSQEGEIIFLFNIK